MSGWNQGDVFLAVQESRDCYSDIGIRGIYLSLVYCQTNQVL